MRDGRKVQVSGDGDRVLGSVVLGPLKVWLWGCFVMRDLSVGVFRGGGFVCGLSYAGRGFP